MAITRQYGVPEVQELARQAGQAQAAREKEAQEFAAEQAKLDRQFKKDMQLMNYQFELEAQQRSKLWELEKMETSSRLDFEYQEKQRLTRKEELDMKLEALRKATKEGLIDPDEYQAARKQSMLDAAIAAEEAGLVGLARTLYSQALPEPTEMERLMQLSKRPEVEAPAPTPEVQVPVGSESNIALKTGQPVNFSDVSPVDILQNEQGEFAFVSPDGRRGWATANELPMLEAQGIKVVKKQDTGMVPPGEVRAIGNRLRDFGKEVARIKAGRIQPRDISKKRVASYLYEELRKINPLTYEQAVAKDKMIGDLQAMLPSPKPYDPGESVRTGLRSVGAYLGGK